jgi:hypothetical protein
LAIKRTSSNSLVNATKMSTGFSSAAIPNAPTIGSATAVNAFSATVAYTAATLGANGVTFTATSSPSSITGTGESPITVSGLTASTNYTFTVKATNANGDSAQSSASNQITTSSAVSTNFLVLAGGGSLQYYSGVSSAGEGMYNGGGGAGGVRSSYGTTGGGLSPESTINLNIGTTYTISVGAGGTYTGATDATNGSDSSISGLGLTTVTSLGGGWGQRYQTSGNAGGCGGGAGGNEFSGQGGAGTSGQGFAGGAYCGGADNGGGGGGGTASIGTNSIAGVNNNGSRKGGHGGNAITNSITGSSIYYGAGGAGCGGTNTSGTSARGANGTGWDFAANTGSGGTVALNGGQSQRPGSSGVVILRLPIAATSTTGSPTITSVGTDTVYKFTGTGSITI